MQPENEQSPLERSNPSKGVSRETCRALMESLQPTPDSNQRGVLEAASQPSCVIIRLSFLHPDGQRLEKMMRILQLSAVSS